MKTYKKPAISVRHVHIANIICTSPTQVDETVVNVSGGYGPAAPSQTKETVSVWEEW